MVFLSRPAVIIKIKLLQNSPAKNYFETGERLFLKNTLEQLENSDNALDSTTIKRIEEIYKKYLKFI